MSTRKSALLALPSASHAHGLGAHRDKDGVFFSVYSAHAEKIQLCLFDASGTHEIERLDMPDNHGGVWHGYLPGARAGLVYGYRAYGAYAPAQGQRFNPHKLLLDPYARSVIGTLQWHDAVYGFDRASADTDLHMDVRDSAPYVPKAIIVDDAFDWGDDHAPRVPWAATVIYEMHVRGFTRLRNDLPPALRGTFAGLGHPSTIDYLKRLGITCVELLPIQLFVRDRFLVEKNLTNYWGYNPLNYFAPELSYCASSTAAEIKSAIKQLHTAGIEVILDVVYNHTGEGNEFGPTLSLRGLDNVSYYRLEKSNPRFYVNDTGCGNTLNFSHPRVIQLALDSLRYWVNEFHVDGFRFDLCTTLGREEHGFDAGAGFFDALLQDPLLSTVKLIAEPWDLGPGGFQLGNYAPGFAEWNAAYRDSVRRYWRGDENQRGALAAGLQGSAHLFDRQYRKPWASINFITAHDGFTLHDVVSYNRKHNTANREDNRDGHDHNESFNWGEEGASKHRDIVSLRERIKRNLLATLLCSHGTPMLLAGDEFGQTQAGNNNAYCQDNETSWLDWCLLETEHGRALHDWVVHLLQMRKRWPLLQGHYFQHAEIECAPGLRDVLWFDERGVELTMQDWQNPTARLLGLRRAGLRDDGDIDVLLLLSNADAAAHDFVLPPLDGTAPAYRVLFDAANAALQDAALLAASYTVAPRALVLIGATVRFDAIHMDATDIGKL